MVDQSLILAELLALIEREAREALRWQCGIDSPAEMLLAELRFRRHKPHRRFHARPSETALLRFIEDVSPQAMRIAAEREQLHALLAGQSGSEDRAA